MDQQLLDYLLKEGPAPEADVLAGFLEEEVSAELEESTLMRVQLARNEEALQLADPVPANRSVWRWTASGGALLAMAAVLFITVFPSPEADTVGNLEGMIAKGEANTAPVVKLKLAAIRDGQASRHRTDTTYATGDELSFRVQSNAEGLAYLLHLSGGSIEVLLETPVLPGENDLALADGQHARWVFDQNDSDSLFAVLSSQEALAPEDLLSGLEDALGERPVDPQSLCLAAQSLGCQCDAIEVMVLK